MSPNIGKKRDEWVGAPWIIPTQEAKGLHSPCDNAALFACEVINHHQESLAEPGAWCGPFHPREVTDISYNKLKRTKPA